MYSLFLVFSIWDSAFDQFLSCNQLRFVQLSLGFCLCWRRNSKMRVTCRWYVFRETPDHSCMFKQAANLPGWFICPLLRRFFLPPSSTLCRENLISKHNPCFLHLSGKYSSCSHVSNIELGLDHLLHTVWNLIIHLNPDVPLLIFNTHPTFPFSVIEQLYWDPHETLEAPSKAIPRDAFGWSSLWWAHHLLSWTMRVKALMKIWHL